MLGLGVEELLAGLDTEGEKEEKGGEAVMLGVGEAAIEKEGS